jgi:hypothetical protein
VAPGVGEIAHGSGSVAAIVLNSDGREWVEVAGRESGVGVRFDSDQSG